MEYGCGTNTRVTTEVPRDHSTIGNGASQSKILELNTDV